MNCPVCKEPVGIDQHRFGGWNVVRDETGAAVDATRTLYVDCDFCGAQEVIFGPKGEMRSRRGPFSSERDCRRVRSQLPSNLGHEVLV